MQSSPPCSVPSCWWQMQALGVAIRHIICGIYLFIYLPSYVALWDSKTPHRPAGERVSWCLETFPLLKLPSWDESPSLTLLPFYLLYFAPFEDNGLPFWVSDVLCQHSEVVLWNLLSIQMFFQWICGGESGLPILFLCHLRTAPLKNYFVYCKVSSFSEDTWLIYLLSPRTIN